MSKIIMDENEIMEFLSEMGEPDTILTIEKEYKTVGECFSENEYAIYEKLFDLFKCMKKDKDKNTFTFILNVTLDMGIAKMTYAYQRESFSELKDILINFFQENEKYEICSEILKIYDSN